MGKVMLIGAGPGDAQLLTVKGLAALQKADVIVYDRLVEPAMLQERKASCKLIYVGKEPLHHPIPQEEIEQILVKEAATNELVVRLKAGDPYVFGRGGKKERHSIKREFHLKLFLESHPQLVGLPTLESQ